MRFILGMDPQQNEPAARTGGLYIGTVFKIRFYLDYSWFLIAALVIWMLSTQAFPQVLPGQTPLVYLVMGTLAAVLFFASILLHELGHSLVSQRCGIPVPRITLLFIGGIAEISREPDDAKSELKIALGGPLVTMALIGVYALISQGFAMMGAAGASMIFWWLALINFMLLVFNAIPGYPLDGGRVLRAILWARSGKLTQSTYIASRIGIGFSWFLMILGVWSLFLGQWNAIILIIIGIFLRGAAQSGYSQAVFREVLDGVAVRDIMAPSPACIPADMPVNLAVDDVFLANHHVAYPVCDGDGEFRGLLRLEYLKDLPREKWPYTSAADLAAAHGSEKLQVPVEGPASAAMRRLLVPGQGRLAVTEGSKLVGIITRHDILHFIRIHSELEG